MEKSRKNKLLIISILIIGIALAGSTFAWLSWRSGTNTTVNFTVTANFSCSADGGGNITSNDASIMPTSCTNSEHAIVREVTTSVVNNGDTSVYMDLWLEIENIGVGLTESKNFKYALTTSPTSCTTGVQKTGSFNGKVQGNKVQILKGSEFATSSSKKYYLYIWLDSAETSLGTTNQSFELSLGGSCTNGASSEPNAPVLDNTGMVPVVISNDGTVTTVSKDDPSWYNYEEKQWANAVLVKQTGTKTRTYYLTTPNETVNQDDILAYYVWIPKYKYKIWIKDGTTSSSPQEIDIVFEDKDTVTTGSEVGEYMTHPAFNFGGEKLSGIWVGKFETSASPDSNCFKSPSDDNCRNNNIEPRILPKVNALNYQYVGNQFMTALKFSGGSMDSSGVVSFGGSTTFGLSDTTNSHMMKNSEWGAVAYLSHSKYGTCTNGTCTEIRLNNYWSSPKSETGCGAATSTTTSTVSTCAIRYGAATAYPQSTTGNISGVFDMSGGLDEYVMGNYYNTTNTTYFAKLPESKYYDVYTIASNSSCTLTTCGGHALFETASWYSDYAGFVDSFYPWFRRGGDYFNGTYAGAFYSYYNNGYSLFNYGFRSVLLASGA